MPKIYVYVCVICAVLPMDVSNQSIVLNMAVIDVLVEDY